MRFCFYAHLLRPVVKMHPDVKLEEEKLCHFFPTANLLAEATMRQFQRQ